MSTKLHIAHVTLVPEHQTVASHNSEQYVHCKMCFTVLAEIYMNTGTLILRHTSEFSNTQTQFHYKSRPMQPSTICLMKHHL